MLRRALLTCLWSLTVAGVANAQTPYSVFKERKNDQKTLEIVAVLPIAAKTGVLFEFVRGDVQSFRVGVIFAATK